MERDGRNYNRGSGGTARGRSGDGSGNRGGRGGNYPHQQYGVGGAAGAGAGGGGGRGRGRGWGPSQQDQNQGQGGVGGGRGGARARGPSQQGQNQGGAAAAAAGGRGVVRGWGPPQTGGGGAAPPPPQGQGVGAGPTSGVWSGRPWSASPGQSSQTQFQPPSAQGVPEQALPDVKSLEISEKEPQLSLPESSEKRLVPIRRPDRGGTLAFRSIKLLANHFPVKFNPESIIMHYDVDIKPNVPPGSRVAKRPISKSDLRLIMDKRFSDDPTQFPEQISAYDGEKNIFSAVPLPTGTFNVDLSNGKDTPSRSYTFSIQLVNNLKHSKLNDYLREKLSHIPRDILQGMDLVMKENPSRHMISVGRNFYSKEFRPRDDLGYGIAAYRGFQQSLKPTSQGLVLCLDYSVLAFRKQLPVIDFLVEYFAENDVRLLRREQVMYALKGLKVYVTHRVTHQKYVIAGLTDQNAQDITFTLEDREGENPPREIGLVEYFREKYNKEIMYQDMPCLDLGKRNYVPMEFCVMVEGQTFPKEQLRKEKAVILRRLSLTQPRERKNTIYEMVQSEDGPCGNVAQNFGIEVKKDMTRLLGRVMEPPLLKLGTSSGNVMVLRIPDKDKCQWNLTGKSVVEGKPLDRWALIDFSSSDRNRCKRLNPDLFIRNLRTTCRNMGVLVADPIVRRFIDMNKLSSIVTIQELLESVVRQASKNCKGKLQLIMCVMPEENVGNKYLKWASLKWVSETRIGVLTQCCLSKIANQVKHQDLANIGLKINCKLGGSNVELNGHLPGFEGDEHVMFLGADVNHPKAFNASCPSIAAVVASINWPACNRYAARICPQEHRKEKIVSFGAMCLDLVNTYAQLNKVKPKKIVVFRDGVSEGQFDIVLNEELLDLKNAIYEGNYRPTITLVVAQKRHQTRLFHENESDGGKSGNVPPGTVVDTTIVHPFNFDFYLCSHYGNIGTSMFTHYSVLWDENNFTSNKIQKLTYDLCFTFARCTKPVSLVPPVYYADLVAYRGRQYQEVVMELPPPPSVSSSSSGTSMSSSDSFNERFYTLHPDLQNAMFFI